MDAIVFLFDLLLVDPMTNILITIARIFGGSFGLAIIVFTIVMRLVTWPLTSSQYKSSRAMQALQPKLQELQKKYKGKDPKKYQQEMMALYKEAGVNPLGCLLPMLVQMPIWIALYQVIRVTLGETPESLVALSDKLYPISFVHTAVPLENQFLIWNLGQPDGLLVLPILVAATMYIQQKMITPTPAAAGPLTQQQLQQQQTQQMMTWMLPLMFGWFAYTSPAGLGLYWAVSNLAGIVTQYFYLGRKVDWQGMLRFGPPSQAPVPAARGRAQQQVAAPEPEEAPEEELEETPDDAATTGPRAPGAEPRRKRHGRRRGKR